MSEDPQKNLAVMHHWFDTVNENDVAKMLKEFAEIATEDYLLHDPATPDLQPGLADYLKLFEQQLAESADRKATIDELFAVDDKVVLRGVYEYLDLATQKRNKVVAMGISRFEGGKIKEEWQILAPYAPSNK
jgi:predicted SnoaL-like aldol condensation-catalyzing enzyme